MKAEDFLRQGADVLAERGKDYDQPQGERSMGKCVRAFNAITGRDLSEAEGWLLLQVLKDVRQWQNPDRYHADSAIDGVSYSALKAEALSQQALKDDIAASEITFMRADAALEMLYNPPGLNESLMSVLLSDRETLTNDFGKPDWKYAPDWATHIVERLGVFEFAMKSHDDYFDGPSVDGSAKFLLRPSAMSQYPWTIVEPRP